MYWLVKNKVVIINNIDDNDNIFQSVHYVPGALLMRCPHEGDNHCLYRIRNYETFSNSLQDIPFARDARFKLRSVFF